MAPKREGLEWQQVRVLEELDNDPRLACLHCCPANITSANWQTAPKGAVFVGGPSRIRGHGIGGEAAKKVTVSPCTACPPDVKKLLQEKQAEVDAAQIGKKRIQAEVSAAAALAQPAKKQMTLAASYQQISKEEVDMAWAEWAYSAGIAHHTLGSPLFQQAVTMSAKYGVSYKVPDRRTYSTALLDKVRYGLW
jgi:hypothetical protein